MHIHSPIEIVTFTENEFVRFNAPKPDMSIIDDVCDCVLSMVSKEKARAEYYNYKWKPVGVEVKHLYKAGKGLTPEEKVKYLDPLLLRIAGEGVTIDQLHLIVWAALIFCWTQEGYYYVQSYQYDQKVSSDRASNQDRQDNVLQLPMATTGG